MNYHKSFKFLEERRKKYENSINRTNELLERILNENSHNYFRENNQSIIKSKKSSKKDEHLMEV